MAHLLDSESDETLLASLTRRDPAALDVLYSRYGRLAFALAYRMLESAEAAEDAVQEGFLAVWRHAGSYQQARGSVRAWLLTVIRNRALDLIRAREARPKSGASLEEIAWLADEGDPAEDALRRIEASAVRSALNALPAEQRQVVELTFYRGLSYPEVAAQTGTPVGTVKSRMRLALTRLRGVLAAGDMAR